MIPKPLALSLDTSKRCVREATTNGTTHGAQALYVFRDFRKGSEEQRNVRQRSCGNKPCFARWLSHERVTHSENGVPIFDRRYDGFWQQFGSIEASFPYVRNVNSTVPMLRLSYNSPP